MRWLWAISLVAAAAGAHAAAASGVHWRLDVQRIECTDSSLTASVAIRYLGPSGPVEAPLVRLVDAEGRAHPPRSLAWKRGSKAVAQWLSAGGIARLQGEDVGEVALQFPSPPGQAKLEFGDIPAFEVKAKTGCLAASRIQPPRRARGAGKEFTGRIYRGAYPCREKGGALRTVEADHPPQLPRRMLVLGRGYLPAVREVELPMGRAPAQSYAYSGPDELDAIEKAARRAIAADFPGYAGARYFAFNWGEQRPPSGNPLDSIGIYELQACRPG